MEKIAVRKNVYFGFCMLYWILALVMMLTDKGQQDPHAKRIYVTSLVFAALSLACEIIPIIGWIASIVVLVFYIITIVNVFKGNYDYEVPVINGLINNFVNK